jgi:hypothetical protein
MHLARLGALQVVIGAAGMLGIIWAFWVLGGFAAPLMGKWPLTISAAVSLVVCYCGYKSGRHAYGRASIGASSERRVAKHLAASGVSVVLNGAMIGAGGDADHIVLGPSLLVVETKTGYGAVRYASSTLYAGSRAIPGDPVAQVNRQARTLGRQLGSYINAVVCVVDMVGPPFTVGRTTICSLGDLIPVIAALPATHDRNTATALGHKVWATNATVLASRP